MWLRVNLPWSRVTTNRPSQLSVRPRGKLYYLRYLDNETALADFRIYVELAGAGADRNVPYWILDLENRLDIKTPMPELSPSAPDYLALADAYLKQGNYEKAVVYFDEALRLKSDYADAYSHRGLARLATFHIMEMLYDTPFPTEPQNDLVPAHTERNEEMRARYEAGETGANLARAYGISDQRVNQIIRRRRS